MPQISPLKTLPQSRTQCTVTVSTEEASKAEAAALARLAEGVNVQGFRPGKAPPEMVKSRIKEEALLEETVRELLPPVIEQVLKENNLQPILPPRVALESKSPLSFTVTFVLRPEVTVKKIDTKSFKKTEPKFDEKDVERMVQYLLEQYRTAEVVERAAEDGDQVTMDFVGTGADGKEIPGTRATKYQVVIGSKSLIPGFEDALKGMAKGAKKDIALTFPAEYHAKELQGKPVTFAVEVTQVEKVSVPALTPEFVKEKNLGDSPEDMRKRIADSMRLEEERADQQRREQALFEAIRNATTMDLAPEFIDQEVQALFQEFQERLQESGQTLNEWFTRSKQTPESLQKDMREEATKRITLRFAVEKLLEERAITLTPEEEKQAVEERLAALPEDQRLAAASYFGEKGEGHAEVVWAKRVEKLVRGMLDGTSN